MLEERRWRSFWRLHCEKSRRRVWRSAILLVRDEMSRLTAVMSDVKKVLAKAAEPTGWPRRRNPEVSSTGIEGADLSVRWGKVGKEAIVVVREEASTEL